MCVSAQELCWVEKLSSSTAGSPLPEIDLHEQEQQGLTMSFCFTEPSVHELIDLTHEHSMQQACKDIRKQPRV